MDLLEEANLLLQTLNASLQVQPGQSSIINILDMKTETCQITNKKGEKICKESVVSCKGVILWN